MSGAQYASSGRGGAGNFVDSTKSPKIQPADLQTPTLKTNLVTTGRGGAGNVFKGEEAAQAKHASNDSAIEDKVEGLAAKGKALFFGKKDRE
ncbi:hypothetical protein SLS63_001168 [Diaporthe eres]|uniref:Uncharacterized protein n=1 Tax=Diaporthe eres TaxID=83184 RepID=A0ABR1PPC6_DIAER